MRSNALDATTEHYSGAHLLKLPRAVLVGVQRIVSALLGGLSPEALELFPVDVTPMWIQTATPVPLSLWHKRQYDVKIFPDVESFPPPDVVRFHEDSARAPSPEDATHAQ